MREYGPQKILRIGLKVLLSGLPGGASSRSYYKEMGKDGKKMRQVEKMRGNRYVGTGAEKESTDVIELVPVKVAQRTDLLDLAHSDHQLNSLCFLASIDL
ncbi:hypothetical protein OPV22_020244 [Ensete ventricosum]|uniref:Uncharacterized protein n=1 Tax=Ensete ventricosum TaxID=4639 RepID=A0AAV8QE67_ENSVE|nr:hypothetical protein OPV22_020244 [Ensete ventricosum]